MANVKMITVSQVSKDEPVSFTWTGRILDTDYLVALEKGKGPYHKDFCFQDTVANRMLLADFRVRSKTREDNQYRDLFETLNKLTR